MTNLIRSNFQDHPFHLVSPSPWPERCLGNNYCGLKLSNSGDILKLMIPSCNRRVTSGWSNYSGKEISHNIFLRLRGGGLPQAGLKNDIFSGENKMDYRGSKSVIYMNIAVKEQRVYGS